MALEVISRLDIAQELTGLSPEGLAAMNWLSFGASGY